MSAKRKRSGFLTFLLVLLACACAGAIGYSGYRIYAIRAEYRRGENTYADVRDVIEKADAAERPAGSAIDFAPLREINADTVAWIAIPDTRIDYPVVKGEDNAYYLDHLFTGERGSVGSIFMERTNAADFSDKNTILFGHHMKDGSMFAGLDLYRSQAYYEAHPTIKLYAPGGDCELEIFAGYAITAQPLPTSFESRDAFMEYVADAFARSDFKADAEVLPGDRILTLCTCSYVSDDARYILVGVFR